MRREPRPRTTRRAVAGWLAMAAMAAGITAPLAGGAAAAAAGGTVVSTGTSPFGTILVVGSGRYAGYAVYLITSDQPPTFHCSTKVVPLPSGPGSCTGPSSDKKAEWPALTTHGAPVAGTGVDQALLGMVHRAGIGTQVTYNGHPLYLFDTGPGQVTGNEWDEPSLPPWQGVWYTVSPQGLPAPWPGMLTTTTVGGQTVLATLMFTGIGLKAFPVYSDSADSPTQSACTGSCAVAWPPLLTEGSPGVGPGVSGTVGTVARADGTVQVTYDGKPLYLYSQEQITKSGADYVATGNGNGVTAPGGGTFALVSP